jgi:hypothetical protein
MRPHDLEDCSKSLCMRFHGKVLGRFRKCASWFSGRFEPLARPLSLERE